LLNPGDLPDRAFMEIIGQLDKTLADQKKEKPSDQ
jgi:hypothetical protein